jgi:3',5'-cyclic AMP phosphodiesterase CpdA
MTDSKLITRRQAIVSISAFTALAIVEPSSILSLNTVKDSIRFAVIGDWGSGYDTLATIAGQIFKSHQLNPIDFVLTVGDNIYPDGGSRHFEDKFERPFARILEEKIPFYATLGNHDVMDGRNDQCRYPLFNMGGECYYSVKQGEILEIFVLDSTDPDSAQIGWLENSLRASKARWKIASLHYPLYSSGKEHGSSKKMRKVFESLFIRYAVNVVFSGHDHIYERTVPHQGVHYFVTGAAGKLRRGDVDMKSDFRAASFDEACHFMVATISDKQLSFEAISEAGLVIDSGNIKRG